MNLATSLYKLTSIFPSHELYGLTSQMRRAAISIGSNIAEGAGRETRKDFRHFVLIARGSAYELESQLQLAFRLGYCDQAQLQDTERRLFEVGRMLSGLAKYLKNKLQR